MEHTSPDNGICGCKAEFRFACYEPASYWENLEQYCILHLPSENKEVEFKEEFKEALRNKLNQKNFDFRGTVFPGYTDDFKDVDFDAEYVRFDEAVFCGDVDFRNAQFSGALTSFKGAKLKKGANFSIVKFSSTEGTDFSEAEFCSPEAEFCSVTFGGAEFGGWWQMFDKAQFHGEKTSFLAVEFSSTMGTSFRATEFSAKRTDFSRAKFSGTPETVFIGAQFDSSKETTFREAQFSGLRTDFSDARFSGECTDFSRAQFSSTAETEFKDVQFSAEETSFSQATFKEKVAFVGKKKTVFDTRSWVWFEHARIDKPELLTFNTVLLRPGWFVNTDVRKVDFTDVKWHGVTDAPEGNLKKEIEALENHGVGSPYTRLAQACQRIAANAEENHNYLHASEFNYWAMDARRKRQRASAFAPWRLIWWYWALSGYGERTWRSATWLLAILVGFALLYLLVGQVQGFPEPLDNVQSLPHAVAYSLGVMSRQVDKLPSDASILLQYLVFIEGILGPLQVALFALALRRKFTRGKG